MHHYHIAEEENVQRVPPALHQEHVHLAEVATPHFVPQRHTGHLVLLRRQVFQRLLSVLPNHVDRALNRLRRQVVVEEPDRVRDFVERLAIIVAPQIPPRGRSCW